MSRLNHSKRSDMKKISQLTFTAAILLAVFIASALLAQKTSDHRETLLATVAAQPPNAPGMTLTTVIAEYAPGTSTPSHRHGNAFAMVYILEGTIVSKVDGKEVVLHAGDHFTEDQNAHHEIFRNPSTTKTTRVLAVFLAPGAEAERDLAILDQK
jgi:quercetin dioxygenase-like cupin family protein